MEQQETLDQLQNIEQDVENEEAVEVEDLADADDSLDFTNETLRNFINKYHLKGMVNSVKWEIKDEKATCNFISQDNSVVGTVVFKSFPLPENVIAIYETSSLVKLLKILDNDIDLKIETRGMDKTPVLMKIWDDRRDIRFRLSEHPDIIQTPSINHLPDFQLSVEVTEDLIADYSSAEGAISGSDATAFITEDDDSMNIVVGYSQNGHTNKVHIHGVDYETEKQFSTGTGNNFVMFKSSTFKEILNANADMGNGTLDISEEGLARFTFSNDLYDVTYYVVALDDNAA